MRMGDHGPADAANGPQPGERGRLLITIKPASSSCAAVTMTSRGVPDSTTSSLCVRARKFVQAARPGAGFGGGACATRRPARERARVQRRAPAPAGRRAARARQSPPARRWRRGRFAASPRSHEGVSRDTARRGTARFSSAAAVMLSRNIAPSQVAVAGAPSASSPCSGVHRKISSVGGPPGSTTTLALTPAAAAAASARETISLARAASISGPRNPDS